MTIADTVLTPARMRAAESLTLRDRILAARDALVRSPAFQRWAGAFPLTRAIARRRSRAAFDLCAGFVYTQTLDACVRLDLFTLLAHGPLAPADIAVATSMPIEGVWRLLRAAEALGLLQGRSAGRFGLGPLGAPLLANPGLTRMIEHNRLLYATLTDPLAVLRGDRGRDTAISRFFAYASSAHPDSLPHDEVAPYSALMTATVEPIAEEVLDVCSLDGCQSLLDVGGGEGAFVAAVAARHPSVRLTLFDLPSVVARAHTRLARMGIADRVTLKGGDFHIDAIPSGADVVTLVRVLLDHSDDAVRPLLARVRASLRPGGRVIIAEALAGVRGARAVGDVYFGFYLAAMGGGRARTVEELRSLLREAGFSRSRVVRTRYPVHAGVVVGIA